MLDQLQEAKDVLHTNYSEDNPPLTPEKETTDDLLKKTADTLSTGSTARGVVGDFIEDTPVGNSS